jgi:hypothetical protein
MYNHLSAEPSSMLEMRPEMRSNGMHFSAIPLPSQGHTQVRPRHDAGRILIAVLFVVLLWSLIPQSASARVVLRRDRRSDREVTVTYQRSDSARRQSSGYVARDRRAVQPSTLLSTNSGENAPSPSNKNDEKPPVRDTTLRLVR